MCEINTSLGDIWPLGKGWLALSKVILKIIWAYGGKGCLSTGRIPHLKRKTSGVKLNCGEQAEVDIDKVHLLTLSIFFLSGNLSL